MKRNDFRITVEWHYPDLKKFVADFNAMGGNLTLNVLNCHLNYPDLIDDGWMNAYSLFFRNKFRPELIIANMAANNNN